MFESIRSISLAAIDTVLSSYLPNGKKEGSEYVALNPTRWDSSPGSFKINLKSGEWADFATGDKGGDLIALVAYLKGIGQKNACEELKAFLNGGCSNEIVHPTLGLPNQKWTYHSISGEPILFVFRFDKPDGKEFRPYDPILNKWQSLPEPRPIYNLHLIHKYQDAIIVICEGEKSADAAAKIFTLPEYVTTTSISGAQSAKKADWAPLFDRKCLMWPDADKPGGKYADNIDKILNRKIPRIDLSKHNPDGTERLKPLPEGYDAYDALNDGWRYEQIKALIAPTKKEVKIEDFKLYKEKHETIPPLILRPGGLFQEIMEFIDGATIRSHPLLRFGAAETILGTLAGSRIQTKTGLWTNNNRVFIAPSGLGKTQILNAVKLILNCSDARDYLGATEFTSESAILRRLSNTKYSICLMAVDEIGYAFQSTKRFASHSASIPALIMKLHSSAGQQNPHLKEYLTDDAMSVKWHSFNLLGTATPTTWWQNFTTLQAVDGFLTRFLIYQATTKEKKKKTINLKVPVSIIKKINDIYSLQPKQFVGGNLEKLPVPFTIDYTPQAEKRFSEWSDNYESISEKYEKNNPKISIIADRIPSHCAKIALELALSHYGIDIVENKISIEQIDIAIALCDYIYEQTIENISEFVADSEWHEKELRILSAIDKVARVGRPGATLRDIQAIGGVRYPMKLFDELFASLKSSGEIVEIEHQGKAGPKVKLFCRKKIIDET